MYKRDIRDFPRTSISDIGSNSVRKQSEQIKTNHEASKRKNQTKREIEVRRESCVENDSAPFVLCRRRRRCHGRDIQEEEKEATGGPKLSHRAEAFREV